MCDCQYVLGLYGKNLIPDMEARFKHVAPIALYYGETSPRKDDVSEQIRNFYFENNTINNDTVASVVNVSRSSGSYVGNILHIVCFLHMPFHMLLELFLPKPPISFVMSSGNSVQADFLRSRYEICTLNRRCEDHTAVTVSLVFWVVTPCELEHSY
jgi:hypothetical protein